MCASNQPPAGLVLAVQSRLPETDGADWVPLSGGRTNRVWQVGKLVVKLFAPETGTPLFPNDPLAEARALKVLDGTGVAPNLLAQLTTPEGEAVVYEAIEGFPLAAPDAGLAAALGRLHALPAPKGFDRMDMTPEAILATGHRMLGDIAPEARRGLAVLVPPPPAVTAIVTPALLHRDAVVGNAIASDRGVMLIDWQCPAIGDPAEDIAIALSPAMQVVYGKGPVEEAAFLDAYPDPRVVARYLALKPLFAWRMAAYCLWKMARGDRDYAPAHDAERRVLDQV